MKLKKTKKGVEIIFDNDIEKKILGLFLYHADLDNINSIISLNMFDNLVLNNEHRTKIKRFVEGFATSLLQLAERGVGCPDNIYLATDLFELYSMLPDYLVVMSIKDGIQIADLYNPMDWLFGEI